MTLNDPTVLQQGVGALVVLEVDALARVPDYVACSRILLWSLAHELGQVLDIVRCHCGDSLSKTGTESGHDEPTSFGIRQVHCHTPRYANLIKSKIGIAGNDRSCGKVHSLAHQVSPQAALLALQSCPDSLNWPSALLHALGDTSNIIVHIRRNVVLQQLLKLGDDVCRSALLFGTTDIARGLDYVRKLVCQVVL